MPPPVRRLVAPAALVALAAAVFAQVRHHAFLLNWDDLDYVVANELIQGLGWANVRAAFAGPYFHNYAPLHLLSYAVDHALWGLDAGAFLLTNVALHAANGVLLLGLLTRLGLSPAAALAGAALFVVHPVQVESVAWVSERKNVLAMTFSLGALHAFVSYRTKASARAAAATYAGALALAIAALLTKAAAVVLAPLLLLLELCVLRRVRPRRAVLEVVPFALAAAALAAVTVLAQGDAVGEGRVAFDMGPLATALTMAPVVAQYVGMVLWPAGLSAMYAPPIRDVPDAAFLASAALLAGLAAVGALLWTRARPTFFWYAAFFIGLLPVLHVVPLPTLMNDRYLYFPMLGVAGLAAAGVDRLARRSASARRGVLAAAALAVAALVIASHQRAGVWREDLTLWRDVTEKTPRATLGWVGLGMAYTDAGRLEEAAEAYRQALALEPLHALALNNLGGAYNQLGRPTEARAVLERAVLVDPGSFNAQMNLGLACLATGDLDGAERAFRGAAALRPGAPEPLEALLEVSRARAESGR